MSADGCSLLLTGHPTRSLLPSPPKPQLDSQSDFNRFEQTKLNTDNLPSISPYVASRFCPPDKCSGRLPLALYESVDRHLRNYFLASYELHFIRKMKTNGALMRKRMITNLCWRIENFDISTPEEQSLLLAHVQQVCLESKSVLKATSNGQTMYDLFKDLAKDLVSRICLSFARGYC